MIRSFKGSDLKNLDKSSPLGVYLVQSVCNPTYFRIGASGIKAPIWNRLKSHSGGPPSDRKNPPNWTELNRPWNAIWAAQIQYATDSAVLCAEHYICGQFSQRYPFVSESGFRNNSDSIHVIINIAESCLPAIETIASLQTEPLFSRT